MLEAHSQKIFDRMKGSESECWQVWLEYLSDTTHLWLGGNSIPVQCIEKRHNEAGFLVFGGVSWILVPSVPEGVLYSCWKSCDRQRITLVFHFPFDGF